MRDNQYEVPGAQDGPRTNRYAFLDSAVSDYNDMFGTTWDTTSDGFKNYYRDLAMRLKNRELDLVIVVNMFLAGFDATESSRHFERSWSGFRGWPDIRLGWPGLS